MKTKELDLRFRYMQSYRARICFSHFLRQYHPALMVIDREVQLLDRDCHAHCSKMFGQSLHTLTCKIRLPCT